MELVPQWEHLRPSLVRWAWRGALCALPSFVWALGTINLVTDVLAMVVGVAVYVFGFAWITAQLQYRGRVEPCDFGWALRIAANTRAALAPLMFCGPDWLLGVASISAVDTVATALGLWGRVSASSFFRILSITVVQGALVSFTMFLLALLLWPARRAWKTRRAPAT